MNTAVDLFCGAGGMTEGLKEANFNVLGAVENSGVAVNTYKQNHNEVNIFNDDIRNINVVDFMAAIRLCKGELDLLAGCPPCQGFSTMRTKNGAYTIEDRRNDLLFEFLRFTETLYPKFILLENVPGLAKDWRIHSFIDRLKSLGYLVNIDHINIINAADYGVPQRRRRMILAASRLLDFKLPPLKEPKKTVRDTIWNLPQVGVSGDPLHDYEVKRTKKVLLIFQKIPKDGGSRSDLPKDYWLPCHIKNPYGFRDVYGRMKWDDVAPTITGGCISPSKGRFLHPEDNRAITLREAALLQSFPINYKFSLQSGLSSAALMIGNALPPLLVKKHGCFIREILLERNR